LEEGPPVWATWESNNNYLPAGFYNHKSSSSLLAFKHWLTKDPITAADDALASYKQVELIALAIGLAFQALWVVQFPKKYSYYLPILSTVPIPFLNVSNSVTMFTTLSLGMLKRMFHY
jgi:hypothetical protein